VNSDHPFDLVLRSNFKSYNILYYIDTSHQIIKKLLYNFSGVLIMISQQKIKSKMYMCKTFLLYSSLPFDCKASIPFCYIVSQIIKFK